jgi:hypothetical protein
MSIIAFCFCDVVASDAQQEQQQQQQREEQPRQEDEGEAEAKEEGPYDPSKYAPYDPSLDAAQAEQVPILPSLECLCRLHILFFFFHTRAYSLSFLLLTDAYA